MNFKHNLIRIRNIAVVLAVGVAALVAFTAQASAKTPLTVHNVCQLNRGLGAIHYTTIENEPVAYWDNNHDGIVDFLAYSDDGDTAVDAAGIANSSGGVADVALCTQRSWTPAANLETGTSGSSSSSSVGWTPGMSELTCVASDLYGINPIGDDDEYTVGSSFEPPHCLYEG
jgi:hypothetical protein